MSNITGTFVSNFESGVMQVLIALNYASGYTKRKAKKNETVLEDITSICWYLLDTHLERRDNSDLDRFLHVWKETSGEHRNFEEKCSLREYVNIYIMHTIQYTILYYVIHLHYMYTMISQYPLKLRLKVFCFSFYMSIRFVA